MIEGLRKAAPIWITAWGFALALAAFLGWVISSLSPASLMLTSGIVAVAGAAIILAYVGTVLHLLLGMSPKDFVRPHVKLYRNEKEDLPAIFLFSPADWMSYNAAYTMFVIESDGFERLMGIAQVLNVQNDKSVQVVVPQRAAGSEKIWSSLDSGSREFFKSIVIKPGVPIDG